jgi:hypothetical protein
MKPDSRDRAALGTAVAVRAAQVACVTVGIVGTAWAGVDSALIGAVATAALALVVPERPPD